MRVKRVRRLFAISIISLGTWFGYTAYSVHANASIYSEKNSDVIAVLGASSIGNELSPVFKERLNHVFYLFSKGIVNKLLLTGGVRPEASESESHIAKLYLLDICVPDSVIYIDQMSQNTFENLQYAKKEMKKYQFHSALIVSDPLI